MTKIISNPFGYVPDEIIIRAQTTSVVVVEGDVMLMRHNSAASGPGFNLAADQTATQENDIAVYGVALEASASADTHTLFMLRGVATCKFDFLTTNATVGNAALCAAINAGGNNRAVTSAKDLASVTGSNEMQKIIGLWIGQGDGTADGQITIVFDGLAGFGMASTVPLV